MKYIDFVNSLGGRGRQKIMLSRGVRFLNMPLATCRNRRLFTTREHLNMMNHKKKKKINRYL